MLKLTEKQTSSLKDVSPGRLSTPNDFYPFVRAELWQRDPTMHDLLVPTKIGDASAKAMIELLK